MSHYLGSVSEPSSFATAFNFQDRDRLIVCAAVLFFHTMGWTIILHWLWLKPRAEADSVEKSPFLDPTGEKAAETEEAQKKKAEEGEGNNENNQQQQDPENKDDQGAAPPQVVANDNNSTNNANSQNQQNQQQQQQQQQQKPVAPPPPPSSKNTATNSAPKAPPPEANKIYKNSPPRRNSVTVLDPNDQTNNNNNAQTRSGSKGPPAAPPPPSKKQQALQAQQAQQAQQQQKPSAIAANNNNNTPDQYQEQSSLDQRDQMGNHNVRAGRNTDALAVSGGAASTSGSSNRLAPPPPKQSKSQMQQQQNQQQSSAFSTSVPTSANNNKKPVSNSSQKTLALKRVRSKLMDDEIQQILANFEHYDKNKDEVLDEQELTAAVKSVVANNFSSEKAVDDLVKDIITASDDNGDGRLSIAELKTVLEDEDDTTTTSNALVPYSNNTADGNDQQQAYIVDGDADHHRDKLSPAVQRQLHTILSSAVKEAIKAEQKKATPKKREMSTSPIRVVDVNNERRSNSAMSRNNNPDSRQPSMQPVSIMRDRDDFDDDNLSTAAPSAQVSQARNNTNNQQQATTTVASIQQLPPLQKPPGRGSSQPMVTPSRPLDQNFDDTNSKKNNNNNVSASASGNYTNNTNDDDEDPEVERLSHTSIMRGMTPSTPRLQGSTPSQNNKSRQQYHFNQPTSDQQQQQLHRDPSVAMSTTSTVNNNNNNNNRPPLAPPLALASLAQTNSTSASNFGSTTANNINSARPPSVTSRASSIGRAAGSSTPEIVSARDDPRTFQVQPKFGIGDVLERNSKFSEYDVGFGGDKKIVQPGEKVTVSYVSVLKGAPKSSPWQYFVQGGNSISGLSQQETERYFDLVKDQ